MYFPEKNAQEQHLVGWVDPASNNKFMDPHGLMFCPRPKGGTGPDNGSGPAVPEPVPRPSLARAKVQPCSPALSMASLRKSDS